MTFQGRAYIRVTMQSVTTKGWRIIDPEMAHCLSLPRALWKSSMYSSLLDWPSPVPSTISYMLWEMWNLSGRLYISVYLKRATAEAKDTILGKPYFGVSRIGPSEGTRRGSSHIILQSAKRSQGYNNNNNKTYCYTAPAICQALLWVLDVFVIYYIL